MHVPSYSKKENSKQSSRPYLNLAAALVVGVSAGALTSYKVGIDEREALGLKELLLEKGSWDKSVRYNLDQAMGVVSSKDDERNQLIEKIEESLPGYKMVQINCWASGLFFQLK